MMNWDGTWSADWSTVVGMCALITLMTLGWVALGTLVWVAVRAAGSRRRTSPSDPTRILDARFARGEVNEEEYLSARSLLDAHMPEAGIRGGRQVGA